MPAFALSSGETQFCGDGGRIVFLGVGFEGRSKEGFDFLDGAMLTLAVRPCTTLGSSSECPWSFYFYI